MIVRSLGRPLLSHLILQILGMVLPGLGFLVRLPLKKGLGTGLGIVILLLLGEDLFELLFLSWHIDLLDKSLAGKLLELIDSALAFTDELILSIMLLEVGIVMNGTLVVFLIAGSLFGNT